MSISTKVGKDTSTAPGGSLFQTFRDLLKQREALDHQILRMQGTFFQMMEQNVSPKIASATMKKYVSRMQNYTTLSEAVRECMIPGKRMGMKDILAEIDKTGAYHTKSKYFYTMVNNKLHELAKTDDLIEKPKGTRGIFVRRRGVGRPKSVV